MSFNLEDKVRWDELSPSLQDMLKNLYMKYHTMFSYYENMNNTVRITIGTKPPTFGVKYNELWFDTKYMVLRCLTDDGWILTRAYWYEPSAETVLDEVDAPRSRNPRTTCHCYSVEWEDQFKNLCHCHKVTYIAPIVGNNKITDTAFNVDTSGAVYSTDYRIIVTVSSPSVFVETLNAINADNPGVSAIQPINNGVTNLGEITKDTTYNTVPQEYNFIFDDSDLSGCEFTTGTKVIPITFTKKVKLSKFYGQIQDGIKGPVKFELQEKNGGSWFTISNVTLNGNYVANSGKKCYNNRHAHGFHSWFCQKGFNMH